MRTPYDGYITSFLYVMSHHFKYDYICIKMHIKMHLREARVLIIPEFVKQLRYVEACFKN